MSGASFESSVDTSRLHCTALTALLFFILTAASGRIQRRNKKGREVKDTLVSA